jgi:hypothetical protein
VIGVAAQESWDQPADRLRLLTKQIWLTGYVDRFDSEVVDRDIVVARSVKHICVLRLWRITLADQRSAETRVYWA